MIMRRLHRTQDDHTTWCARDHRCGLNEHRSPEMIVNLPGAGRVVVTRVRAGDQEYAEIRGRVQLHPTDVGARWQLKTALAGLGELLATVRVRAVVRHRPAVAAASDRPALTH